MSKLKFYLSQLLVLVLMIIVTGCKTQHQETITVKPALSPLGTLPISGNGYGMGSDQLAQPDDVEILANGSLIITDVDNNRIQYFHTDGHLIQSINNTTLGLEITEIIPTGVSSDGAGFVYVSLEGVGTIARFTPEMEFDQFIGYQGKVASEEYYLAENDGLLMMPQGIMASHSGDIFVIDMSKKIFKKDGIRNFGFRKFKQIESDKGVNYVYDTDFAKTQEITTIMRKSEGMAISTERNLLFIAEEKPSKNQFGNKGKFRYIGVFDLSTGKFLDRLIGVNMQDGVIIDGTCNESIEGLAVFGDYLFAVAEKDGRVDCYNIDTGERVTHFGSRAPYYCDDESDCIMDGINYNEQSIIAGTAQVHLLNDWKQNELASPDGISVIQLETGERRLAVVDQWNSRILLYDLDRVLSN